MSNFICQIICICQFMVLTVSVMVLKAKNNISTNLASLDFSDEVDNIFRTAWL